MNADRAQGRSRFYRASDGLRLHVRDYEPGADAGIPVVCLTGLTRNADDFAPLAQALASRETRPRRVAVFDYRGRGLSDHAADWHDYNMVTEGADIRAGLADLGIGKAHFIGTSRGGLHIMAMSGEHRALFQSIVLNDIGPVLEPGGLERIKSYIGQDKRPRDYAAAIDILKAGQAAHFTALSPAEWHWFAAAIFGPDEHNLAPRYDLRLAKTIEDLDLGKPLPDLWPQFDALAGLPVLTIRGQNSDLLSPATFEAMRRRWPGCDAFEVAAQGHAPLLTSASEIARIANFIDSAEGA